MLSQVDRDRILEKERAPLKGDHDRMPKLLIRESGERDEPIREIELPLGESVLGRSVDSDLHLENQTISRRHATIASTSQGYILTDQGSANGTWVNGKQVTRHLLRHEDSICFGTAVAVFHEPPDPDATIQIDVQGLLEKAHKTAALNVADLLEDEPTRPPEARPRPPAAQPAPQAPAPSVQPPPERPAPPPAAASPAPPPPPASTEPRPAPPPRLAGEQELRPSAPPVAPPARASKAATPRQKSVVPSGRKYGGFWIRVLAWIVDGVILTVFGGLLTFGVGILAGALGSRAPALQIYLLPITWAVTLFLPALYLVFGWARSGRTFGKMACGLRVVHEDGGQLGFGGAIVRLIGYMLSSLIFCIGYLMVAFTDRKRGLHDMLAGTVVVRDR